MLLAGSSAFAVLGHPQFLVMTSGSLTAAIIAHAAMAIEAVIASTAPALGVEVFVTRVRSSGYAIGYNTSVAVFGGTTPYLAKAWWPRLAMPLPPPITSSPQR